MQALRWSTGLEVGQRVNLATALPPLPARTPVTSGPSRGKPSPTCTAPTWVTVDLAGSLPDGPRIPQHPNVCLSSPRGLAVSAPPSSALGAQRPAWLLHGKVKGRGDSPDVKTRSRGCQRAQPGPSSTTLEGTEAQQTEAGTLTLCRKRASTAK